MSDTSKKSKEFVKKVLAESINKAEKQKDEFGRNQIFCFCDYHGVNLSDVAHYIKEMREEGVISSEFGKNLRCIEL